MRDAGFERVYLPLESVNTEVVKSCHRSHSNVQMFEHAMQNGVDAGFILRNMQINAFLLFGTPGEDVRGVVDSITFASSRIGWWSCQKSCQRAKSVPTR
jgi:coproporphyrinogen III oxidase-like Fe-S oxidoreductase